MVRLAIVSDSHLSPREAVANGNWDATIRHLEATEPDLVIHTGDISLDGANDVGDLTHAKRQLDRIPTPWLAVPGNHDLGEPHNASSTVIERRRSAYESVFGDRFWSRSIDGWWLVGIDSQQLLDPGDSSDSWWEWIAARLETELPTVVFQHRPLMPIDEYEVDNPIRYVTEPVRTRLRSLLARPNVRLVVSGHVHQWRSLTIDGTTHVWAPSTWATMGEDMQPVIGTKTVGLVEVELDQEPLATLTMPPGIDPAVIGETMPSPYRH